MSFVQNIRTVGTVLLLAGLGIASSSAELLKWSGITGLAIYALVLTIMVAGFTNNGWLNLLLRDKRTVLGLGIGLVVFSAVAFFFLYPLSHSGRLGAGSDRAEALNIALRAILHGQFPYYFKTHYGNPISPMPGAFLLAYPFFLLGDAAFQNVFWLIVFFIVCWKFFPTPRQALLFMGASVLGNLSFGQDFMTGGDYCVNLLYVTMAVGTFYLRLSKDEHWHALIWPIIFLGIALASRPIYFITIPPLFFLGARGAGTVKSLAACLLALGVSAALIGPFYFYDPAGFSPLHIAKFIPTEIPYGTMVLPAIALLIACSSLMLKLDRYSMFGLLAAALAIIFLPTLLAVLGTLNAWTVNAFDYSYPVVAWAGIWLASRPAFFQDNGYADVRLPGVRHLSSA